MPGITRMLGWFYHKLPLGLVTSVGPNVVLAYNLVCQSVLTVAGASVVSAACGRTTEVPEVRLIDKAVDVPMGLQPCLGGNSRRADVATSHHELCLPSERSPDVNMNLASYNGTRLPSFPTTESKVTSFTVLLTGSTVAVTDTAVTTCSSSDDCTVSPADLWSDSLRIAMSSSGGSVTIGGYITDHVGYISHAERVHVEGFDCNAFHLILTGSDKVKSGRNVFF